MSSPILVNMLLHWPDPDGPGRTCRVLWISAPEDSVVIIDIHDKHACPEFHSLSSIREDMKAGVIQRLDHDPYAKYQDRVVPRAKQIMERRWSVIEPLVTTYKPDIFIASSRGKLVEQAVEKHDCSKTSVYAWLRAYWQRGQTPFSLMPKWDACGKTTPVRPRGRRTTTGKQDLTSEDVKNMITIAERHLWKEPALTWDQAYNELLETYYRAGYQETKGKLEVILKPQHECPTMRQFRYHVKKEANNRRKTVTIALHGEKDGRGLLGDSKELALGPGAIYVIDATVGDVYLSSAVTGDVLERFTLYLVQDWFTQMIVGFHVAFDRENYLDYALAIDSAIRSKVALAQEYGLQISEEEWPCSGKPMAWYLVTGHAKISISGHLNTAPGWK